MKNIGETNSQRNNTPNQGSLQKSVDRPFLTFLGILSDNQSVDSGWLVFNKEITFHQFETHLKPIACPLRWFHIDPFTYLTAIISSHKAFPPVINLQRHFPKRERLANLRYLILNPPSLLSLHTPEHRTHGIFLAPLNPPQHFFYYGISDLLFHFDNFLPVLLILLDYRP